MAKQQATGTPVEAPNDTVVVDTMPRAVIVADRDGHILRWNQAAEDLFGWSEGEVLGRRSNDFLHPANSAELAGEVRARIVAGETFTGDLTLMHRDGHALRVRVANRAVVDDGGETIAIVGVSEDVSQQRALEQQTTDLAEQLRVALDVGGLGTWRWDLASGRTEWDERIQQLYGLHPGNRSGTLESWYSSLHRDDRARVVAALEHAVETKGSYQVEHRVVWPDGTVRWIHGKGQMILDDSGAVAGAIGCSYDVTEQAELAHERERVAEASIAAAEAERLARERLEFLSEINDALAAAGTQQEAMRNVTQASVPRLGDWCSIYVLPDNGSRIPDLEVAHTDPEMVTAALEFLNLMPYDPDADAMIPRILRTGETAFYRELDDVVIATSPTPIEIRSMIDALSLRSVIGAALVKHDRVLGAIQFVNSRASRSYTDDDVVLAEIVAGRIAAAIDNLRLRENEQMIARTLQASLLPESLPVVPGVDIAVRYWATGEGTEVGGDFYDVFEVEGSTAVVMGDVCGTGPMAAATTGLARHTIRASAWHGGDAAAVLSELNHAMLRSGRSTFCTVCYTTLTPVDGGVLLEITSGGHPLPLICRRSGEVEVTGRPGTLVGMLDDVAVRPVTTMLQPGDTVVLYTDGVTDVRPPHDIDGASLQQMVHDSCDGAASADHVADRLRDRVEAVLPLGDRHDDIALMVLRITD